MGLEAKVNTGDAGAKRVESLLIEQHELFDRLDALSQRQASLIRADETDRLLRLLSERQGVIDQIAGTNAQLEPYRGRWEAFLDELPVPNRERVRKRLDAVAHLAGVIAQRDESDRLELERRRDAMAVELAKISNGRGAMAAYGGTRGHASPQFQDREA
jgi:hypothetical protein